MFCTNCGKEIIDTAKFCNFCGAHIAASVPVQPVQTAQQTQPFSQTVQPAPEYTESESIPVAENISENISDGTSENAESVIETAAAENTVESGEESTADVPTPNVIPTFGSGTPVYSAPLAYPTEPAANVIPVQSAELNKESKPERRYTLGHIMMCLAAVAIMAIVAGVFAGLYFSVV